MKILVTGSEGSLMQSLIPKLLAQGHTIIGIDNLYRWGEKTPTAGIAYDFYQQDLLDYDTLNSLAKDVDIVIHAAAKIYGVLGLLNYRADILSDDLSVCRNVLRACVANNIKRVIYLSSSMVYDSCIQDANIPLTESMTKTCPLPKTDYGLGKLVCERMVEAFRQQYGLSYTIWRPFNIVSPQEPSMHEIGFSHVLPDIIKHVLVKKLNPVPIIGDGNQIRCFTWIDDVSNIIAENIDNDKSLNQCFNVCNVEPFGMKDVAKLIFQKSGGNADDLKFETIKNYEHDVKIRVPSIKKLQTVLGPYEFVKTEDSIQKCIQHYLK
jgi:nucleoside-diphosphate-sugar epimerase